MNTGEDITALRKIVDFTRYISIFILAVHFYLSCYVAFESWGWTTDISNKIIEKISKTGLFSGFLTAKISALVCLIISLIGLKGRKEETIQMKKILGYLLSGLLLYFFSIVCFYLNFGAEIVAILYIGLSLTGYLQMLSGGTLLSRLIKSQLNKDVFNTENETFPQEERLLENEYSINLPAKYQLKDRIRDSWINIINPFRGILIAGSPGAGKSYFLIRHIIDQHLRKGFSMFLYDFKFDGLSKIAYNKLLKYYPRYQVKPKFYIINFEDLSRTHRCNPLDPVSMDDITDATEASRTNMLKLDISEVQQNGDTFFSSTDTAYLIFMIIGILGYFSVPTIANYVVHAGGGNSMQNKVNSMVVSTGAAAMGTVSGIAASKGKSGGMVADRNGDGHRNTAYGMAEGSGQDYFRDRLSGK